MEISEHKPVRGLFAQLNVHAEFTDDLDLALFLVTPLDRESLIDFVQSMDMSL